MSTTRIATHIFQKNLFRKIYPKNNLKHIMSNTPIKFKQDYQFTSQNHINNNVKGCHRRINNIEKIEKIEKIEDVSD